LGFYDSIGLGYGLNEIRSLDQDNLRHQDLDIYHLMNYASQHASASGSFTSEMECEKKK
jgi:hypothetical protein